MDIHQLNAALGKYFPGNIEISTHHIRLMQEHFSPMELEKSKCFLEVGKSANHLGILLSGELIAYHKDKEGKKIVSRFFFNSANPVVVNFAAFKRGTKSEETIEALSSCLLFVTTKEKLDLLFEEDVLFEKIGRHIAEESYIRAIEKNRFMQNSDNPQKVQYFHDNFSDLLHVLKAKDIASYLGMSESEYSRMKKKYHKK